LTGCPALAASVNLAWNPSTTANVTGYRVYYGTGSQNYSVVVDVGLAITAALSGLEDGKIYYFAVTAYNGANQESLFSNEVLYNPVQPKVIWAANGGGPQYTDGQGIVYKADTLFTGGYTYTAGTPIAGTTDDPLYQSERYGNFSYAIPVANGDYLVTLKFAEIYWTQSGKRVFNVLLEGVKVISHLDLVAKVGANTAYNVTLPVSVKDGKLNIKFQSVVDYAKVSAILVQAK
jgi:hypothetical protein